MDTVLVLSTASVLCWFQTDLGKKKSIGFIYEFLSLSQEDFLVSLEAQSCFPWSWGVSGWCRKCLKCLQKCSKKEISQIFYSRKCFSDWWWLLAGPLQWGLFLLVVGSECDRQSRESVWSPGEQLLPSGEDVKPLLILSSEDLVYSCSEFHEQGHCRVFPKETFTCSLCPPHPPPGPSLESVWEQLCLWDVTADILVTFLPCSLAHNPTVKLPAPKSGQLGPSSLLGHFPACAISWFFSWTVWVHSGLV